MPVRKQRSGIDSGPHMQGTFGRILSRALSNEDEAEEDDEMEVERTVTANVASSAKKIFLVRKHSHTESFDLHLVVLLICISTANRTAPPTLFS